MRIIIIILTALALAVCAAYVTASALKVDIIRDQGRAGVRFTSQHGDLRTRLVLMIAVGLSTLMNFVALAI